MNLFTNHAIGIMVAVLGVSVPLCISCAGFLMRKRGAKLQQLTAAHEELMKLEQKHEKEQLKQTVRLTPEINRLLRKDDRKLTPEEFDRVTDFICARGDYLVEQKISEGKLDADIGHFIAIDIFSSEFRVRESINAAASALHGKLPKAQIYAVEIKSRSNKSETDDYIKKPMGKPKTPALH